VLQRQQTQSNLFCVLEPRFCGVFFVQNLAMPTARGGIQGTNGHVDQENAEY